MIEIRNVSGLIAVGIGLFIFGLLYNALVAWMERRGYDEGYTSLMVVVGVIATLIGVAMLDLAAALLCAFAFVSSGTPMILGAWWRHVEVRRRSQMALRKGR